MFSCSESSWAAGDSCFSLLRLLFQNNRCRCLGLGSSENTVRVVDVGDIIATCCFLYLFGEVLALTIVASESCLCSLWGVVPALTVVVTVAFETCCFLFCLWSAVPVWQPALTVVAFERTVQSSLINSLSLLCRFPDLRK